MENDQQQNNNQQSQKEGKSASERLTESMEARQAQQHDSGGDVSMPQQKVMPKEGMNKYVIIGGVVVAIFIFGVVYRAYFVPEAEKPIVTGIQRSISIITFKDTWKFEPEFIEADQGDEITFTITNNDEYDHGFAIDAFGISQRMPAKSTIQITFVVTKAGDFPYYCSVSCGSGVVDGEDRGHFDQIGRLHVKSIISETVDYGIVEEIDFAVEARNASMIKEAQRKLEELGYIASEEEIQIDANNALWLQQARTIELLDGIDYQALYFTYPEPDIAVGVWIFIDTTTGGVVDIAFDE